MPDPKGKILVPVGFTDAGNVLAWQVSDTGVLRVEIPGGVAVDHQLLDGSVHPDTKANSPAEGDLIVGIVQVDTSIKWDVLPAGATGQVLTAQADGSLAWADPAGGGGAVVQSVYNGYNGVDTTTSVIPQDNTIPQNTEGKEFMSVTITPTNAANSLEVSFSLLGSISVAGAIVAALFRDSGADALAVTTAYNNTATAMFTLNMKIRVSAGSTSATTFKVRAGPNTASTMTFNGQSGGSVWSTVIKSSITVVEYSG